AEPGGRTVTATVNGSGDLTSLRLPDSSLRSFTYSNHLLTGDQHGSSAASYSYSATTGGLATATLAGGNLLLRPANAVALATSPAANLTAVQAVVTDPNGHATSYTLDGYGRPSQIQQPLGASSQYLPDGPAQPPPTTDPP